MAYTWLDNIKALKEEYRANVGDDGRVALYVTTYGGYSSAEGDTHKVYPGDYDSAEDFNDECEDLFNEEDPEVMIIDGENVPNGMFTEYTSGDEIERLIDYARYIDNEPHSKEAAEAYIELFGAENWDERKFKDSYLGEFDDDRDYYYSTLSFENGNLDLSTRELENCFDYSMFVRDYIMQSDLTEEEEERYARMTDRDVAYEYIQDNYGSFDAFARANPGMCSSCFSIDRYIKEQKTASDGVESCNGYYFNSHEI